MKPVRRMAKGGKTGGGSQSKGSATKGNAPAAKTGSSAAGKTINAAVTRGGRDSDRPAVAPVTKSAAPAPAPVRAAAPTPAAAPAAPKQAVTVSKSTGAVTRAPATGREGTGLKNVGTVSKAPASPGFSGFSLRGLTSTDPANVARNRAAAAMYEKQRANREATMANRNSDRGVAMSPAATPASSPAPAAAKPAAPAMPASRFVGAGKGYRAGRDPEHLYFQPVAPMKKGGAVKKGKKK